MTVPYRIAWLTLAVLAGAVLAGCQTPSKQEFNQVDQATDYRRLYEPLASSDPALLERLDTLQAEHVAFELTPAGAQRVPYPLPEELLWSPQRAVFYKVQRDDGTIQWLYFNGLKLRVEALERPLPADGDLVPAGDTGYAIYRSVPVRKGGVVSTGDLDLFRYEFTITEDGRIDATGYQRITRDEGEDLQPAPMVGVERVVYVHQDPDAPHALMIADPHAGPPRPLFDGQDFDALFPALLPDGRLVFFSDQLGYLSLFQLDDAAEYVRALERYRMGADNTPPPDWRTLVRPFEYPFPQPQAKQDIFVASVPKDGALQPVLLRLPETLDLATIVRLTEAHNARVNERRARYAAALIDAARYKLNNWPRIDLGLSFEDRIDLFGNVPRLFTGDTLSEQAWTFLVGLTQPLLDFKQNKAFEQSALEDAEVARQQLAAEIQNRITEAADLYFEAVYLKRLIDIQTAQLAVTRERGDYYRTLRDKREATRLQIMGVDQVVEGLESERAFHQDRLAFLESRLKEVMGLPSDTRLALANERFALGDYALPPLEQSIHQALTNHPSLLAAKHAVASAFYQQAAGPDVRPRASLGASYESRNRDFNLGTQAIGESGNLEPVVIDQNRTDEIVSLALSGQVPLASWKAKRLHGQFWTQLIHALRLAQEAEARRVRTAVEEAYMDFQAAQRDIQAKRATQAYFLEKLRVARLQQVYGPPGTQVTLLRPPDEPGAIEETLGTGVEAPLTAHFEYLRALDRRNRTEMELGQRFARVWRETGRIDAFMDALGTRHWKQARRMQPAVWLWRTKDAIGTDDAVDEAVSILHAQHARRVYAYLYSDARLLADTKTREQFTLFVEQCARWDIEVWALLGEPEWITSGDSAPLGRAMDRILEFNAQFGSFEPKLAGVKLDLEPHAQPGWDQGGNARAKLEETYLSLLDASRQRLEGDLPLWVDAPPKFFREDEAAFLGEVAERVDGATLMDYFSTEPAILKWAQTGLDEFPKPLEIGLELSAKAPEANTLAAWTDSELHALETKLNDAFLSRGNYAGWALHDFAAVNSRQPTE